MTLGLAMIMASGSPLEHVLQHPLITREADLGPLTPQGEITLFSDHISMLLLAGLLLLLLLPRWVRRRQGADEVGRLVPTGFGNAVEAICQYLRKEVAEPNLHHHTDRFIKYIWTLFFFILTINILGLTPIAALSPLLAKGLHLGGTATGNIWVTGTLAVFSFFLYVGNGIRLGGKAFFEHLCPGPLWLAPLLVVLEVFGLFVKAAALAVRLFANMTAGHVLLAVLLSFIGSAGAKAALGGLGMALVVVPSSVAVNLLELFVALLQAFIFTFLTTVFLGMSVLPHGPEEAHAHH